MLILKFLFSNAGPSRIGPVLREESQIIDPGPEIGNCSIKIVRFSFDYLENLSLP